MRGLIPFLHLGQIVTPCVRIFSKGSKIGIHGIEKMLTAVRLNRFFRDHMLRLAHGKRQFM